jgi:hypothetical protein
MRLSCIIATICVLFSLVPASAVTLERLSVEEMTDYSTYIVRASVSEIRGVQRGPVIYTEYALTVRETLKGNPPEGTLWVSLPGGAANARTQRFAGVPELSQGPEYLLFLREGRNGVVQLMGMSQGLFEMEKHGASSIAARPAIDGVLLDRKSGFRVQDKGMRLSLRELRSNIDARGQRGGSNR